MLPERHPPGRGRAFKSIGHYQLIRWLDDARTQQNRSLNWLGQEVGHENGSRVSEYFRGKRVPGPAMIRRLAASLGLSPTQALWRGEHWAALLDDLSALYRLGWTWCHEDRVSLGRDGSLFLARIDRPDPGCIPHELQRRYHLGVVYNTRTVEREVRHCVNLPRPLAAAFMLGIGLFPRRGDRPKGKTAPFLDGLLAAIGPMVAIADKLPKRGPWGTMPATLDRAKSLFSEVGLHNDSRTAVFAEYVHTWADAISLRFAEYTRLALYTRGGHYGGWQTNPWLYQAADIPSIEDFLTDLNDQ